MKKIKGGLVISIEGEAILGRDKICEELTSYLKDKGYECEYINSYLVKGYRKIKDSFIDVSNSMNIFINSAIIDNTIDYNIIPELNNNKIVITNLHLSSNFIRSKNCNNKQDCDMSKYIVKYYTNKLNNKLHEIIIDDNNIINSPYKEYCKFRNDDVLYNRFKDGSLAKYINICDNDFNLIKASVINTVNDIILRKSCIIEEDK